MLRSRHLHYLDPVDEVEYSRERRVSQSSRRRPLSKPPLPLLVAWAGTRATRHLILAWVHGDLEEARRTFRPRRIKKETMNRRANGYESDRVPTKAVGRAAAVSLPCEVKVSTKRKAVANIAGRMSSAASSSFSQRTSRLPSPSPSPSSATSQSLDTASVATSHDPLDVLDEEVDLMDVDKTPTKPKTRHPVLALPTPPPSSPFANLEIDATAKRIGLVRMCSDTSDDTSTDTDEARDIGPYKSLKSFLRLANSGDNIVGRHEEQKAIREYVAGTYKLDVGMYVSGPPGTGKTATVTSMAKALGNEGWRRIEICCMGLKANDLWAHLGNALNCAGSEVEVCSTLRNTEDPL